MHRSSGKAGLSELGRHGGYIDPVNDTYMPIEITYNTMKQTESDLAFLNQYDKEQVLRIGIILSQIKVAGIVMFIINTASTIDGIAVGKIYGY